MGDKRPLLIGEAPGRDPIPPDHRHWALTGASGRALARMADMEWVEYLRRTRRANLFWDPQPRWSSKLAEAAADEMIFGEKPLIAKGDRVVLLGARVARAFRVESWPLYEWRPMWGALAVRLPHPSGRNRLLNDPAARAQVFRALRRAMHADS